VVALKPSDTISAKLLQQIENAGRNPNPAASGTGAGTVPNPPPAVDAEAGQGALPAPAAAPPATPPPAGATIFGTWKAEPNPDTSIALTIDQGGAFTWKVTQKGQTQQFSGTSSFGGGLLTLVQDKGPPLVGRVSWTDPTHMTYRVIGDSLEAPGVSFSK
jgi:hypothetical protein